MKNTRWACPLLLLLCVALWALSYFYVAVVVISNGNYIISAGVEGGRMDGICLPPDTEHILSHPRWRMEWHIAPPRAPFSLHLVDGGFLGVDGGFLGFIVFLHAAKIILIPFWFPTVLLSVASLYAWLKKPKSTRGFPVEVQNPPPSA